MYGQGMASGYAPMAAIAIRDHVTAAFWGEEEDEVELPMDTPTAVTR
jgi:adenosylmethionine-8-amino-7-oxononanoate aminotransferase